MDIEVLVSTMENKNPVELYEKMNIKTDAIIINQFDKVSFNEIKKENSLLKIFCFNERGIGLSRNNALMRSSGEICMMADDDMIYEEDYLNKVKKAYKKYPDADMIVFNVEIHEKNAIRNTVKKDGRVRWFNCLRYGTVTFSFKRENIVKNNIFYSLDFGGGAKFGSGEDSLFIWEVIKKKNKVYAVNETIAKVYNYNSTWFTGYNKKFFFDKGALFKSLSPRFSYLLILQFLFRNKQMYNETFKFKEVFQIMKSGSKKY